MRPWLVLYGTLTALVEDAADQDDAYVRFIAAQFPERHGGRLVPPERDEVTIRQLVRADADWIRELPAPRFHRALKDADE